MGAIISEGAQGWGSREGDGAGAKDVRPTAVRVARFPGSAASLSCAGRYRNVTFSSVFETPP